MATFLRRNWPYVLVPILIVLAVVVWALVSGDGDAGDFGYRIGH